MKRQKGFTLIEILVAFTIFCILVVIAKIAIDSALSLSNVEKQQQEIVEQVQDKKPEERQEL